MHSPVLFFSQAARVFPRDQLGGCARAQAAAAVGHGDDAAAGGQAARRGVRAAAHRSQGARPPDAEGGDAERLQLRLRVAACDHGGVPRKRLSAARRAAGDHRGGQRGRGGRLINEPSRTSGHAEDYRVPLAQQPLHRPCLLRLVVRTLFTSLAHCCARARALPWTAALSALCLLPLSRQSTYLCAAHLASAH
eukprot:483834-Pleurochrysis_carterae.AAC.2